ncbi:MAG: serine/threonine-protein kinase [Syntrophobacteraceae bacterium]|nr:serine/threonine-protein kinase [Syntrophobacteraceae bacterium]
MVEIGTVFEDRYKILASLGQGGFGATFLAEDLQSNGKVVMKVPHIAQLGDPAVYERFRREVAIGKLLNHSDVPVAVAISEGSPPYLVLKYAEGESLAKVLNEQGRISPEQVTKMVPNLLDALHYCHERGVYHRDIKPENLVLAPDGHLKILDFGIALMEGSPRVTWRGFSGLMGTPEYMAPEQIKGERGGAQSDIYAVGCLLYHLLSGSPPFTGDNPLTIMYQHMTKDPEPLTSIKGLHPGIRAVVSRALRRRKEERFETAEQMANELRSPENADLSWIDKPDPPLAAVLPTGQNNLLIYGGAVLAAVLIVVLLLLLKK